MFRLWRSVLARLHKGLARYQRLKSLFPMFPRCSMAPHLRATSAHLCARRNREQWEQPAQTSDIALFPCSKSCSIDGTLRTIRGGLAAWPNCRLCLRAMDRRETSSANKVGPRNGVRAAVAGVCFGGGGAGAGENGARGGLVGLDRCQDDIGARIVENQGLGAAAGGGVASLGVASRAVCEGKQGVSAASRQIASFPTAASWADLARARQGGATPRGGPARQLTPGSARRGSAQKARAAAPFEALQALQGSKNRENLAPDHGVGGGRTRESARSARLTRLNSCAKLRLGCHNPGRGKASGPRLSWGKVANLCGGRNRVN